MKKYIIGIDEGTTSTRAVLYDYEKKQIVNIKSKKITQFFPKSGWVEQDADEIYKNVLETISNVLIESDADISEVASIGITNQRETVVAWNKKTLLPVYHAIVWQCRRTSEYCANISKENKKIIRQKTGLLVDPYFSATKMKWIIDNVDEAKKLNDENNLRFGTMDTYIMARLSKGKIFATDVTNASRTMLMNIHTCKWDTTLTDMFGINIHSLAEIKENSDDFGFAEINNTLVPINGVIGDQQSSLFGQGCFNDGQGKNTFGTGCFILVNCGDKLKIESNNLLSTVAWKLNGKVYYALEGSVFNAGSSIDWAKNQIKLFRDYKDINSVMLQKDCKGVYFVPALTGLGAPYWEPDARGVFVGLTRATDNTDMLRAIIQSFVYSTNDILKESLNIAPLKDLYCDGGVCVNTNMLQFLADITGLNIYTETNLESTVMGSIYMAGLRCRIFKDLADIKNLIEIKNYFKPNIDEELKNTLLDGWDIAVKKCLA